MKKSIVTAAFAMALLMLLLIAGRAMAAVGSGTVDDLKAKFNEDKAHTRVIALLSPT
jgi:hypothetical protein